MQIAVEYIAYVANNTQLPYILMSEVRKVKSNKQVAMNKNSYSVQNIFSLWVAREDSAPTQIMSNFWNCPNRVEL